MSLADRLAQARRDRGVAATDRQLRRGGQRRAGQPRPPRRDDGPVRRPQARPCTRRCWRPSGPKLYDARLTQTELEQKVRQTLQEVLSAGDTPLTAPTGPGSRRRSPTTSSATARSSPTCATPTSPRSWSTVPTRSSSSAAGGCYPVDGQLHRRGPPAAHHRQDRRPGGPPGRRVQPDGRRPAARRQPGQRGRPAARGRRLAADDPQVRHRPATRSTTWSAFGTMTRHGRRLPRRLRPGPAEHPGLRRHRRGQDDHAQRAVVVTSPRTSAWSPSRTPPSCSCTRTTCCGWSRGRRTSRARAR